LVPDQPADDHGGLDRAAVGGGAGRTFNIWKQEIDLNLAVYWNAARPTDVPKWQLSLQFHISLSDNSPLARPTGEVPQSKLAIS